MYKRRTESLQLKMKNYVYLLVVVGLGCLIDGVFSFSVRIDSYQDLMIEYGVLIQLVIKDITLACFGVITLFIARNIKRNKLFVTSTANLVGLLGWLLILGSISSSVADAIWDAPHISHIIENAVGIILIVLSRILNIGIKMKEEIDLTI